jgi:hypothetical protein
MPTLNLLAEVLLASEQLVKAQQTLDFQKQTFIGRLPIVRSKLASAQIELNYQKDRVAAAIEYLNAIESREI